MSVLAVHADGARVVMASDDRALGGPGVEATRIWPGCRKFHRVQLGRETALVGAVGSAAAVQLARHMRPPRPPRGDGDALDRWVWQLVRSLRDAALARGITYRADDGADGVDGTWLLGFRGIAWHLTETTPGRVQEVTAIGSGADAVLGAVAAQRGLLAGGHLTWPEVLRRGVEAACAVNAGCGPPIHVEVL